MPVRFARLVTVTLRLLLIWPTLRHWRFLSGGKHVHVRTYRHRRSVTPAAMVGRTQRLLCVACGRNGWGEAVKRGGEAMVCRAQTEGVTFQTETKRLGRFSRVRHDPGDLSLPGGRRACADGAPWRFRPCAITRWHAQRHKLRLRPAAAFFLGQLEALPDPGTPRPDRPARWAVRSRSRSFIVARMNFLRPLHIRWNCQEAREGQPADFGIGRALLFAGDRIRRDPASFFSRSAFIASSVARRRLNSSTRKRFKRRSRVSTAFHPRATLRRTLAGIFCPRRFA